MTDQPIDPAATPDDEAAPEIAADDAGASAIAERIGREGESRVIEPREADDAIDGADAEDEEGVDGEGV
jgi:hypothetical protein